MNNDNTPVTLADSADNSVSRGCNPTSPYPNWVAPEVSESQCENLQANSGLTGNDRDNTSALGQLICDIKQEVDAIANDRIMVIATNNESKCQDDTDPTLASMWSRILRYAQAIRCVLCAYDPFVATLLRQGRYPQILMGAMNEGGYPQWIKADEVVNQTSPRPVTGQAVVDYVQEALRGVWHIWEEYPEFGYFAQTINDENDLHNLNNQTAENKPNTGDTALVAYDGTDYSVLYTYNGTAWTKTKVLNADDKLTNFATTHILSGYYTGKGVYYFHDGTTDTWQVMDTDLGELEGMVNKLVDVFNQSIQSPTPAEQYILTTRPTLTDAYSVPCNENNKTTIVLITG